MDTDTWNCCRTCLSTEKLYPIFRESDHSEKYTDVIFATTGIKVEMNDNLPQEICVFCINFINESVKFQKQCQEALVQLQNRLNGKQYCIFKVKEETRRFKKEDESLFIDISHLVDYPDDHFNDYDDNITLDSLQCQKLLTKPDNEIKTDTNETDNCNDKLTNGNKPKRKSKTNKKNNERTKKCGKEKSDRMKEEVKCEYCDKVLTSRLSLRNHYKIHTGFDVVCEHCGKKFITRRLLLMHCRAKHGYEKTDKCSYCDYRASNAEQVKIHERLHTGERPYVCGACGAGFHRKSSYLQHVAIHLPEKTVQCDVCPARFKSVTLMRIHKNRHKAASYSFQCKVCDNSFARRRNVARHLQRVHNLPPDTIHIDRRKIG